MSRAFLAAVVAVFATTAMAGSASAKTTLTPLGTAGIYYIATDEPVQSYYDVEWVPNTLPDKRDKRIDFGPSLVTVDEYVDRCACWRLDQGNAAEIHWEHVRAMLRVKHDLAIGHPTTCCVSCTVEVPECMRVDVKLYVPHQRHRFLVEQNGHTAIISVMVPKDGLLAVFTRAETIDLYGCDGSGTVVNPASICGTTGSVPSDGDCVPNLPGDDTRRKWPRIDLTGERGEETTWGRIKALYQSEE